MSAMTNPDPIDMWIDYYAERGDLPMAMQMKWLRLARYQTGLTTRQLQGGEK